MAKTSLLSENKFPYGKVATTSLMSVCLMVTMINLDLGNLSVSKTKLLSEEKLVYGKVTTTSLMSVCLMVTTINLDLGNFFGFEDEAIDGR